MIPARTELFRDDGLELHVVLGEVTLACIPMDMENAWRNATRTWYLSQHAARMTQRRSMTERNANTPLASVRERTKSGRVKIYALHIPVQRLSTALRANRSNDQLLSGLPNPSILRLKRLSHNHALESSILMFQSASARCLSAASRPATDG